MRATVLVLLVAVVPSARAQRTPAELAAPDRREFMTSLVATPRSDRLIALTWSVEQGAEGYHILRAPKLEGPYVDLTPAGITGTTFAARGLPGATMVFRVVSLLGTRRDTSGAAYATPHAAGDTPSLRILACAVGAPSTLRLSWAPSPIADLYLVSVLNDRTAAVLASARTRDTTFERAALPAGSLRVRVEAAYTIPDFPLSGDSAVYSATRVESRPVTLPVSRSRPCT